MNDNYYGVRKKDLMVAVLVCRFPIAMDRRMFMHQTALLTIYFSTHIILLELFAFAMFAFHPTTNYCLFF